MATFMRRWSPRMARPGRTCSPVTAGPRRRQLLPRPRPAPGDDRHPAPYLALAAVLASGLWGIEHQIQPSSPVAGNAYEQPPTQAPPLPASLSEAEARLAGSQPASSLSGRAFVEHFARSREWEEAEFRRAVTDWELARYLEVI